MMRVLAALIFTFVSLPAFAQGLLGGDTISSGYGITFSHSPSDQYKFITYKVTVPANSVGFIGFLRTRGTGDFDIRVGTGIAPESYQRARVTGVIDSDDSNDGAPDLLFIPPSSSARTYHIEAWSHDNASGTWRLRYEHLPIFEAAMESLAWATAQYLIEAAIQCAIFDCSSPPGSDNLGRAVTLSMSVLARTDVCSVGTDMFVNEIQTAISREIPNARFLVIWASNFGSTIAGKAARVMCPV